MSDARGGRFAVARLDELDAVPGPDGLTWRPVRAHFDVRVPSEQQDELRRDLRDDPALAGLGDEL